MVEEKGKQAEERHDEPRLWRPWRPPRRRMGWRVLWAVGMVVALVVALLTTALLIVPLHPEIWKDLLEGRVLTLVALGFSLTAIVGLLAIAGARRSWTGFQGKTVWDFLQLLIVPLMLVAVGFWFTTQQEVRQQQIEDQRAEAERKLVQQRAQDEALQAYLDQMNNLLLEHNLRDSEEDREVRTLARARTLTVLGRLDSERNSAILQFLREAQLISGTNPVVRLSKSNLSGADLSLANLNGIHLSGANLSKANLISANLSSAEVSGANLTRAHLILANLSKADLSDAGLHLADLHLADLSEANLISAHLSEAALSGAHLSEANVRGHLISANLNGADLRGANLSRADLRGATMPNGQKYENWLKDHEDWLKNKEGRK